MSDSAREQRRRRESTAVIGTLWTLGAILTLSTTGPWSGFDRMPTRVVVVAVASAALVLGLAILATVPKLDGLDRPLQEAAVATASVAIAVVVVAGGTDVAVAYGGLYSFVVAASFLAFPVRRALAQFGFGGAAYAVALAMNGQPQGPSIWVFVMGVATGGAALFGFLGARAERVADDQRAVAADLERLEGTRQTFLQAVSHELRTPLTGVLGFATVLQRRADQLTPEMTAMLHERLHAQAMRLDLLLTDLLDVERLSRGGVRAKREHSNAEWLVQQSADQVEPQGLQFVIDVPPLTIDVEPAKVDRIVVNLLANAVKHARGATTVWVRGYLDGDAFIVLVEDDGPGVPVEQRDDVLRPFMQGRHTDGLPNPGTGLGLAIVSRFAEIHGGDVTVGERTGGGAQFLVRLPESRTEQSDVTIADEAEPSEGSTPPEDLNASRAT